MIKTKRTSCDVTLTLSIDKASRYDDRSTLEDEIRSWLEGLGLIVEEITVKAKKTGPRFPLYAKDVPPNYVLHGDGWWYPNPQERGI